MSKLNRGFSLIELLVATAVFAIMGSLAYGGLKSVIDGGEIVGVEAERLRQLQIAVQLIDQDIRAAVPRPVRDEFGDPEAALQGQRSVLDLTAGGWVNPNQQKRSELRRVSIRLVNGDLLRSSWPVLDRTQSSQPLRQTLLSDIDELEFEFLDESGEWSNQWPPPRVAQFGTLAWPRAVRWRISSEDHGQIERILSLVEHVE